MPKVRRKAPPQHLVIVDTNILWDKDKKLPVSQDFDSFWQRNAPLIPMTLQVPEVVLGELHFQQTTSALKALASINEQFSELSGITDSRYAHKCNQLTIKNQVRAKLDRWLNGHGGISLVTPIGEINWGTVVDAAVWRHPPFTFDPKDSKNEKGFRDAVILETVAHACNTAPSEQMVIFVCNDYLLRTTSEARLKTSKRFLAFESLPDFESYINLTQQQLTNAFVKSIQSHARSKFYVKGDPHCIYAKHELAKRIQMEFTSDLELQEPFKSVMAALVQSSGSTTIHPKGIRQMFLIRSTQFTNLEGTREFHWASHVDVVRVYESTQQQGLLAIATVQRKYIQVVGIDVKWKANVKADGRFHDIEIVGIQKGETQQFEGTEENLQQWHVA